MLHSLTYGEETDKTTEENYNGRRSEMPYQRTNYPFWKNV